jgi:ketol-acid reductoisomerase
LRMKIASAKKIGTHHANYVATTFEETCDGHLVSSLN